MCLETRTPSWDYYPSTGNCYRTSSRCDRSIPQSLHLLTPPRRPHHHTRFANSPQPSGRVDACMIRGGSTQSHPRLAISCHLGACCCWGGSSGYGSWVHIIMMRVLLLVVPVRRLPARWRNRRRRRLAIRRLGLRWLSSLLLHQSFCINPLSSLSTNLSPSLSLTPPRCWMPLLAIDGLMPGGRITTFSRWKMFITSWFRT